MSTIEQPLCTWPAVDVAGWPEPRIPFPVTVPYRPRPDLARLGAASFPGAGGQPDLRVLDADRDWRQSQRDKRQRLQATPARCVALTPGLAADVSGVRRRVGAAIGAILAAQTVLLAQAERSRGDPDDGPDDSPDDGPDDGLDCDPDSRAGAAPPIDAPVLLARAGDEWIAPAAGWAMPADPALPWALRALRADAEPVLRWIASRPAAEQPLHALALALQEDVVWMESPAPGAPVRATMLHVCWPSGWDPGAKIGLDFASIHGPVADGAALRAASAALSRALVTGGPYLRHVWTLAATGARSRHPDDSDDDDDTDGDGGAAPRPGDPWFRCERQVSLSIPDASAGVGPQAAGGAALFLIRLHRAPLSAVAGDASRSRLVRAALESMSDATIEYKRLGAIRSALRADAAGACAVGPDGANVLSRDVAPAGARA